MFLENIIDDGLKLIVILIFIYIFIYGIVHSLPFVWRFIKEYFGAYTSLFSGMSKEQKILALFGLIIVLCELFKIPKIIQKIFIFIFFAYLGILLLLFIKHNFRAFINLLKKYFRALKIVFSLIPQWIKILVLLGLLIMIYLALFVPEGIKVLGGFIILVSICILLLLLWPIIEKILDVIGSAILELLKIIGSIALIGLIIWLVFTFPIAAIIILLILILF